ncbi:MAG: folate-binding protein [Burkholderiaceae bacterium]|jgi:folate-binding protein YgfZ|nr:folate-binding protein [Burkholderiaceae bacterium]
MTATTPPPDALNAPEGITPLSELGLIRAEGPEAAAFIHRQLTQDFSLLDAAHARLAALCNPQGRMLASFIGIRPEPETVLLVCSADALAATLKRLSMAVLRAKLKITDASAEFALYGIAGHALAGNGLDAAAAPWQVTQCNAAGAGTNTNAGWAVSLYPADGVARALWIGAKTAAPQGPILPPAYWPWSDVRSGVATLSAAAAGAFVPQMLNYESVGGVNFKKGCYPGQEVVARSQFRGALKRRAAIVRAAGPVTAGQDVFAAGDPEQPAGKVVQAAPAPSSVVSAGSLSGAWAAIISARIETLAAGSALHAGAPGGVALTVEPLPYALLDDV